MSSEARNPQPELWEKAAVLLGMVCLVLWALLSFTGCSPQYFYRTRAVYETAKDIHLDLAWIQEKDSVYIKEKGDTIYIYKERVRYRDRWKTDTIKRVKVDSVTVERIKEVKVEQQLPWWKTAQIRAFWWLVAAVLLLGLWTFRKPILKLLKI